MGYIKNFITVRKLSKILETECEYYFYKIDRFGDKFIKSFYKQLIICAKEDLYELFVQISSKELEINKNDIIVSQSTARKLLMLYCFYNTLCFLKSRKKLVNERVMLESLYDIFGTDNTETRKFKYFADVFDEYNSGFELEFSNHVLSVIFGLSNEAPIFLAFIGNFFYNSYQGFMKLFTNYVPLSAMISSG